MPPCFDGGLTLLLVALLPAFVGDGSEGMLLAADADEVMTPPRGGASAVERIAAEEARKAAEDEA